MKVLGAIGWMGKSKLVLYGPRVKVDAKIYLKSLKKTVIPSLLPLYSDTDMVWQQVCALSVVLNLYVFCVVCFSGLTRLCVRSVRGLCA